MEVRCERCLWHRRLSWSKRSSCRHPSTDWTLSKELMSESVGIGVDFEGYKKLGIKGLQEAINKGRFAWPYNYDAEALFRCKGFVLNTSED